MRFDGTDTALMVLQEQGDDTDAFGDLFRQAYKAEFGFVLDEKDIIIDDIKVCDNPPFPSRGS
jgi:5-oxoprolinase (ATP-hydrolysing)